MVLTCMSHIILDFIGVAPAITFVSASAFDIPQALCCVARAITLYINYETKTIQAGKPYSPPVFIETLRGAFFKRPSSLDFELSKQFESSLPNKPGEKELPAPMLVLVATALHAAIEDRKYGHKQPRDFSSNNYWNVYKDHIQELSSIRRAGPCLLSEHADEHRVYTVSSPAVSSGGYHLHAKVAMFNNDPVVFVQGSMHGHNTYRNNQYTCGTLTAFGNSTALYRGMREVAFEEDSPLFHRDIEKTTLVGSTVHLFVLGELVDAWQNRHLPRVERIKMLLRAHYFVKMWTTYLKHAHYPLRQYCISREALDITRILIESLFALIMIHRDYSAWHTVTLPLLPWLHSTEPCKHVFGEARQIVKDFAFLNFHIMIKKPLVKIWEAARRAEATKDPKSGISKTRKFLIFPGIFGGHFQGLQMPRSRTGAVVWPPGAPGSSWKLLESVFPALQELPDSYRSNPEPGPVVTPDGEEEYFVERILDRRRVGRGYQYLVRWLSYGPGSDSWLPGREVESLAALDNFLRERGELPGQ
ncbi:hypothetical protein VTO73DRAFT_10232 [Trametes versicolor]